MAYLMDKFIAQLIEPALKKIVKTVIYLIQKEDGKKFRKDSVNKIIIEIRSKLRSKKSKRQIMNLIYSAIKNEEDRVRNA